MSSTCRSTHRYTSWNSRLRNSHEPVDHMDLHNRQLSSVAPASTHISSPNSSQTFSNSTTPSHNTHSTPGESLSEESSYQLSEFGNTDDQFLGVNFGAGVDRVYSIPTDYQLAAFDQTLADFPAYPKNELSFHNLNIADSELNPNFTNIPNTSRHPNERDSASDSSIVPDDGYSSKQNNPTTGTSTTGVGGTGQNSDQGAGPSSMVDIGDPFAGWQNQQPESEPNAFLQPAGHYESTSHSDYFVSQQSIPPEEQTLKDVGVRDDEGIWKSSDRTGQAGLDPESRKAIADMEVPNFKEQDEICRIDDKNIEIQEWRSHAGGDSETTDETPDEDQNIQPADDAQSIHENKLVGGQVYFNFKNATPTKTDELLMHQPRHWFDAPAVPYITTTRLQPPTANEAMRNWEANADTFSLASRRATWGTHRRRLSEPSLSEMDAIHDGSILKKLSINKPKEPERHRSNSIFDQGLIRLASIVRNKKDSARRKRSRSTENTTPLKIDTRPSSLNKKTTLGLNTTPAVLGTLHKVKGSTPLGGTSPKSPTPLGFARSVLQRARSRSELSNSDKMAVGIADLWRGQGGPPVPNLSSTAPEFQTTPARAGVYDHEEDEEEDDEQADDNDLEIKTEVQSEPIVPNYEGFKAHIRRLNPNMDIPECNWLVSRIGRQQESRYKALLEQRVDHFQAAMTYSCVNRNLCQGHGTLLHIKGDTLQPQHGMSDLQPEFSDDSIPEGALTNDAFPNGIPLPPIRVLPAEFECQLCFKAKKFQKPSDWTKHVHEDLQPFTCTFLKCKEPKSFKRKADWVRHENERHRRLEWWKCEVNDCGHICYRKDNFLQHLVREHKYSEPTQRTKAAAKKSNSAEPTWDMVERCHHVTLDRPQSEPCKFCGRVFNSWKKLMVHNAKHMENIGLPLLQLVEAANVSANTIISPIDQNTTPITPIRRSKIESDSPFLMDNVPIHASPMVPQFTPSYLPTTTASSMYGMPTKIPQTMSYDQTTMYMNPPDTQPMIEAPNFNFLDPNIIDNMSQANTFISTGPSFSSGLPEQGFGTSQPGGYSSCTNYISDAPAVSGYQVPYTLHITDPPLYDFNSLAPTADHNFQPLPSQAQGDVPTYGYPQQDAPHGGPYYGNPQ